jgi:hypothetical protein
MKKIGNRLMLNMHRVSALKVNGPEWALHKPRQSGFCTTGSWITPAFKP